MADVNDNPKTTPESTAMPRRRHRRPRTGDLWTLQDVGRQLTLADDTAARWLVKHNVPRYDVGIGNNAGIRVKPADGEAALERCRVGDAGRQRRERGYVPKYRNTGGGAVTSSR